MIEITKNSDEEPLPQVPDAIKCDVCGEAAVLRWAGVADGFPTSDGNKMWRVRLHYWCTTCNGGYVYRLGGHEVVDGKMVKNERDGHSG